MERDRCQVETDSLGARGYDESLVPIVLACNGVPALLWGSAP
jgi:hypothetical protein